MLLVLAGCASRGLDPVTVHVFSNQPDSIELHGLIAALDEAGHGYRIHYQETPGGLAVGETVLATGEGVAAHNRGLQIAQLVRREMGTDPETRLRAYGNHQFSAGNIGLYLHLPGESVTGPEVIERFAGTCGGQPVEVALSDDHHFELEVLRWRDDGYKLESDRMMVGSWQRLDEGFEFHAGDLRWRSHLDASGAPNQPTLVLEGPDELAGCRLIRPL